jgi:hypothetical protein
MQEEGENASRSESCNALKIQTGLDDTHKPRKIFAAFMFQQNTTVVIRLVKRIIPVILPVIS